MVNVLIMSGKVLVFLFSQTPSVVNRTKLNQKAIKPNRIQLFDRSLIVSAIKQNWTATFQ